MTQPSTISPDTHATAVKYPAIKEIRNLKSGQIIDAATFIQHLKYDRLIQIRTLVKQAIKDNSPRFACATCGVAVYIVSTLHKCFFFRHIIETGSCPAQTRNGLTLDHIRALKYAGAKESFAHKRLKSQIETSLLSDPRFTNIRVESTWRGIANVDRLRRPDVRTDFNGLSIAFEAQISTTFLDVIIDRQNFYRSEGSLLVWILPYFNPNSRNITVDDILFNNNSNILVIDEATVAASQAMHRLIFRCHFRRPEIDADNRICSNWETRLVSWDELHKNLSTQRTFLFDYGTCQRTLVNQVAQRKVESYVESTIALREDILRFFVENHEMVGIDSLVHHQIFIYIKENCDDEREYRESYRILRNAVCGILSVQNEKAIGYGFDRLIQVAHHLHDHFPAALLPFGYALRFFEKEKILNEQDRSHRWRNRISELRAAIKRRDENYLLPFSSINLLCLLFPELANELTRAPTAPASN